MAKRGRSDEATEGASGSAVVPFKTIVNVGARELTIGGAQGEATILADEVPALRAALDLFDVACGAGKVKGKRRGRKAGRRGVAKAARKSGKASSAGADELDEMPPRRKKPRDE